MHASCVHEHVFMQPSRFDDALRLWEALWACQSTAHLHLYLCAAVLIHHRRAIMQEVRGRVHACRCAWKLRQHQQQLHIAHMGSVHWSEVALP